MKASELRIGNLVYWKRITLEGGNKEVAKIQNGGFIIAHAANDAFEPITLTEEWLLRMGFQKVSDRSMIHYELNGIWIYILGDGSFELELETLDERQNLCRQWKYVHQLQNLFHSLTSEELIIGNYILINPIRV